VSASSRSHPESVTFSDTILEFSSDTSSGSTSSAPSRKTVLFDFEPGGLGSETEWISINDGIMGGRSRGMASRADGHLVFSGEISLENGGGFSSIRTGRYRANLDGAKGVGMRVRGDGKCYQFRLYTHAFHEGTQIGYTASFETEKGSWSEIVLPLGHFEPRFRGRTLAGPEMDPARIEGFGLLLADKQEGAFRIEVDWIARID